MRWLLPRRGWECLCYHEGLGVGKNRVVFDDVGSHDSLRGSPGGVHRKAMIYDSGTLALDMITWTLSKLVALSRTTEEAWRFPAGCGSLAL